MHMHDDPDDMAAVLRDYGKEMILPALGIYAHGLLTDATMYDASVAKQEPEKKSAREVPVRGD
jgi:hypothetical protein